MRLLTPTVLILLTVVSTACDGGSSGVTGGDGGASTGGAASGGGPGPGGSPALPPAATACEIPSDCFVRSASCCGSCGAPSRDDVVALAATYAAAYAAQACGDELACPACAAQLDPTLLATCDAGQCVVVDLREHASTACEDATECVVRAPECCECGGSVGAESVIAVSTSGRASYAALVCDPEAACAECEPLYPSVTLDCVAGHCQVVR